MIYPLLYNALDATRAVIGCCPWSIRVQTHGWRHGKIGFFVLSNMARSCQNACEVISFWASEELEKSLAGAVCKQEKKKPRRKVFLSIWKCLNWKKTSKQLSSRYEKAYSFENIYSIIMLWASEGLENSLGEAVYKYDKDEKKNPRASHLTSFLLSDSL